jgi:hypothetical protein
MISVTKSTYKSLYKACLTTLALVATCWLVSCGKVATESACEANFFNGDLSLKVTYVLNSVNTFEFQVCSNTSFLDKQFSVYGLANILDIHTMDPNTHVRLANITDGLHVGDTFQVTFSAGDVWFVMFEDDPVTGALSTTTEIARGAIR